MHPIKPGVMTLVSLCVLLSFQTSAAGLYKWVDADGNVNYTQSPPPPGTEVTTIKPPPPVANSASRQQLEQRIDSLNKLTEQRQKQAEEKQKTESGQAERKRLCEQAKTIQAGYERPRVSVTDSDGNPRILAEEERLQGLEKAGKKVEELCK
jgi:hypothetical protein